MQDEPRACVWECESNVLCVLILPPLLFIALVMSVYGRMVAKACRTDLRSWHVEARVHWAHIGPTLWFGPTRGSADLLLLPLSAAFGWKDDMWIPHAISVGATFGLSNRPFLPRDCCDRLRIYNLDCSPCFSCIFIPNSPTHIFRSASM